MPEAIGIRRVLASDGSRVRSIRLEALADPAAAVAFLETREAALRHPDAFWQERAVRAALSDSAAQFVAEAGRDWVATATVLRPEPGSMDYLGRVNVGGRALLVAVYVRASQRGRGILDALVDASARWARERGSTELALDVHEQNARARSAYARLGFVVSGATVVGPDGADIEMTLAL